MLSCLIIHLVSYNLKLADVRSRHKKFRNYQGRGESLSRLLLFDDNKVKLARKPGKKLKKNPVGCTGEG